MLLLLLLLLTCIVIARMGSVHEALGNALWQGIPDKGVVRACSYGVDEGMQ